ncbi:putative RNA-directed DNA polymerase from transposon X-element [Trichonephila clavipes]|nr:putative RNA-directed DNA polymerase from transposon X-element [Trichonephila clavipes]
MPSRSSKKNMDHPNASDARDFFTPANIAPEHPARQNSRTAPTVHLYQPTKTPTTTTSPSKQSNNPKPSLIYLKNSRTPPFKRHSELLEEFIKIATTIPTRFDASGPFINSAKTKLTFNPVNRNNSNLTLVSWNANGIRTRVDEFREFISEWNPDIINLQETHLQPCHHLAFPNYNIYRTDRTCRGGGTAILIKRSIPHHEIVINNPSFETTAIKIERTNLQPITVISAYRSPRKPILIQDLHQLFRNQDYVLVAGDLNAKHASWSPIAQQNVAGHTIRRFCDSTGYSLNAPLEPTHFHKNLRNTVIDLAICKGMTITDVTSIPELSSDHNPVLFEVCLDNFTAPALSTYAFPNWKKFQEILTNSLPAKSPWASIYSTEDKVNLFADSLESSFQENPEPCDDDFIDHVEEKIEIIWTVMPDATPLHQPHLKKSWKLYLKTQ